MTKFDAVTYMQNAGPGSTIIECKVGQRLYRSGDRADKVFFVVNGKVKISRETGRGKEAIITMIGVGEFFGQECLINGPGKRKSSAITIEAGRIVQVAKAAMQQMLSVDPALTDFFIRFLVRRSVENEDDIENFLINSTEKRLARALLRLSHFGSAHVIKIDVSQETLADIIGTDRVTVNRLMNKFRKIGLIKYNGSIEVFAALLDQVLNEKPQLSEDDPAADKKIPPK